MMEHQTLTDLTERQETLIIETLTALMKVLEATIASLTLVSLITKLIKRTMDSTAIITIIIRNNRKELKIMSFEQWLEQNDEIVSDTASQLLDELYSQYVYGENKTLSDCIFVTEEALDYVDSWFN